MKVSLFFIAKNKYSALKTESEELVLFQKAYILFNKLYNKNVIMMNAKDSIVSLRKDLINLWPYAYGKSLKKKSQTELKLHF